MRLSASDIENMPSQRRAALVNSLSGYKSANLVGTTDTEGNLNLSIVSSVVHLGSHPPLLAMIIRPGGEERHTLTNLLATGQYSINHVNDAIIEAAHQTAARYPQTVSEFDATGLTTQWWQGFTAPLVQQATIKLALQLREHRELTINGTHLVIGEILAADLPDAALRDDGAVNLPAGGTVALSGLDSYYRTSLVKRMAYAKPDLPPRTVPERPGTPAPSTGATLQQLLSTQVQCVLSTVSEGLPRQHLMAYAFDPALDKVYLASRAGTEKVANMLDNPDISLLWDNRTGNTADHTAGTAAMAAGRAVPTQGWVRARATFMLLARNPQLRHLLADANVEVFCVKVATYKLVEGYDTVTEFVPDAEFTQAAPTRQRPSPGGHATSTMPAVA